MSVSLQALDNGIDSTRVEEAEKGPNPRTDLIALLLELTAEEKVRNIYSRGLITLTKFLGKQPKVRIAETCTVRLRTDCAACVREAKETLENEAKAVAAEVARAEAHLAARKARQLAAAYATGFYYRRITHERKVREAEEAAAAKKEKEERDGRAARASAPLMRREGGVSTGQRRNGILYGASGWQQPGRVNAKT